MLDYGAGLGSGSLAILELLKNNELPKIYAIEPNNSMKKLYKHLLKDYMNNITLLDNLS